MSLGYGAEYIVACDDTQEEKLLWFDSNILVTGKKSICLLRGN